MNNNLKKKSGSLTGLFKKLSNNPFGPSKKDLAIEQDIAKLLNLDAKNKFPDDKPMWGKGQLMRTDGVQPDALVKQHTAAFEAAKAKGNIERASTEKHLMSRGLSLMDLTSGSYDYFNHNPNTMSYWFPQLEKLVARQDFFKVPDTKILTLPIELSQYLRVEWSETSSKSRELFNQLVFNHFHLEDDKTYFIKTGTFSQKFQFANCKCSEPREMGDYFSVINNAAMMVGAAHSNDIVVREYIEDVENNPTIYNGMPLHTEYRAFVNMENGYIYDIVPYWHPVVMVNTLKRFNDPRIDEQVEVFTAHESIMTERFNSNVNKVRQKLSELLKGHSDLVGQWSIDIMQNGDDFYIIDMALADSSALTEYMDKSAFEQMKSDIPEQWDWTYSIFENTAYLERLTKIQESTTHHLS